MSTLSHSDNERSRTDLEAIDGAPVVLNLGCGDDDTGVGIDIHYDPDIEHDLNDGIPVEDDAIDRIICQHVLEHLDNPTQLLAEAYRVLRPDGVLEIEVPNVGWWPVRLWMTQDLHRFWAHKSPDREGHWLARRLGNADEKRTAHRTLWTPALLSEHLERAGFTFDIDGRHVSRNLRAVATPEPSTGGQTLHELERSAGDDLASADYWAQTRARVMGSWVDEQNPGTVLDIGCGSGYLTAQIAESNPTRQVVGIDTNEQSIQAAKRRETSARFEVGDATALAYPDNSFDCIIFGDVIEHFEQPRHLLTEARRVLAPGGRVIVSVPAFRALYGPHDEHNDHFDRYSASRLNGLASRSGFRTARYRYTNAVPLVPYFVYQRILKQAVPESTRGSHGGLLDAVKRLLVGAETAIEPPVGITLIAELEAT